MITDKIMPKAKIMLNRSGASRTTASPRAKKDQKRINNIKIPSLALGGNINSTFSKQARKAFLKLREDWQLENFEGSSHFLPMERTEVVVDQIYEFVSK